MSSCVYICASMNVCWSVDLKNGEKTPKEGIKERDKQLEITVGLHKVFYIHIVHARMCSCCVCVVYVCVRECETTKMRLYSINNIYCVVDPCVACI